MEIIIIAAVSENGVIASQHKIPWIVKEDLKFFKDTTYGYPIIMGRITAESLGKPLSGRRNIVISSKMDTAEYTGDISEFEVYRDLDTAICKCKGSAKTFIVGGSQIYTASMKYAHKLLISEIRTNIIVDETSLFFPKISEDIWKLDKTIELSGFILKEYTLCFR